MVLTGNMMHKAALSRHKSLIKVEYCNEGVSHCHLVGDLLQKTHDVTNNGTQRQSRPLSNSTHYRWDGDQLIQEVPIYADGTPAGESAVHSHYETDSFKPLAKRQNGKLFYLINDTVGTPQALYSEQGEQVGELKLMLWGSWDTDNPRATTTQKQPAANESDAYLSLRFQGQQYDAESGLHYNRHRYYDPSLGQYIIPDPIGLAGGVRPQGYVSDPVRYIDLLGLASSGRWVSVKNGKVRIDNSHVENIGQRHAHCQCKSRKKEVVVNLDGTQSHGS